MGTEGGDLELAVVRLAATRERGEIYEREREREREKGKIYTSLIFLLKKPCRTPPQFVSICL